MPAGAEPAFAGEAFFELPAGAGAAAAAAAAAAGGGAMGTASAWGAADAAAGLGPGSSALGGGGGAAGVAGGGVDPLSLLSLRQGLHLVVMAVSPLAAGEEGSEEAGKQVVGAGWWGGGGRMGRCRVHGAALVQAENMLAGWQGGGQAQGGRQPGIIQYSLEVSCRSVST